MGESRAFAALALIASLATSTPADAQAKEGRRLDACRQVLEQLLSGKESIPRELLDKAECVAVIPSAKKFAIGLGGRYGKGAVACRASGPQRAVGRAAHDLDWRRQLRAPDRRPGGRPTCSW